MSISARRMLESAIQRLEDAEILVRNSGSVSDTPAHLNILAFEILLKCALILAGTKGLKTHCYLKLWNHLPTTDRDEILVVARKEMPGHADLSDVTRLLGWYQYIFEKARYPYEIYEGYSEGELRDLSEFWMSLGAPSEEALIQYFPNELMCLIAGLRSYIERRVA